jgi:cyclopropane fatty-acyl-phospholipid synthase-like methyltransferase
VVDYYDHCRNDYRILWRTDENGSIHFGFFDVPPDHGGSAWAAGWARAAVSVVVALATTVAAAVLASSGAAWARERAVRCLRVAARGRAARHDAAQARMTDVCAELAGLRPGALVLDAGCGVGGTALRLASTRGVKVHGVNVQPAHLSEARRRVCASGGEARVRFSAQDFTEMGVADEAVDVVWALESVCHCLHKPAFVAEAFRVLRPGGRIMVADFFLGSDNLPPGLLSRVQEWTQGWALPNLASVPRFRDDLAASGFRDIGFHDVAANVLPSSRRLYKASLVALPIHVALERLGARSPVQGRNVRAARGQHTTLVEGGWTYGIFVATKPSEAPPQTREHVWGGSASLDGSVFLPPLRGGETS